MKRPKMDMANRSRSAFDPYSGAIVIVQKAHSPKMRKPLEWRRREHPMQLQNDVKWSKEFSSASSYSVNTFRRSTNIFASCCWRFVEIIVGRYWLPPLITSTPMILATQWCCTTAGTTPAFLRERFRESIRSQSLRSCAWTCWEWCHRTIWNVILHRQ